MFPPRADATRAKSAAGGDAKQEIGEGEIRASSWRHDNFFLPSAKGEFHRGVLTAKNAKNAKIFFSAFFALFAVN
jgi:hypothetical protein